MYATCRTHYGGLLVAKGRWAQAERELAAAIRMSGACRTGAARPRAGPARPAPLPPGQLRGRRSARVRVRQRHGHRPDPAGPRRRRGRGRAAAAVCRRRRRLPWRRRRTWASWWRPTSLRPTCRPRRPVVDRLTALAAAQRGDYLTAQAALARGRLAVATGRLDEAVTDLQRGLDGFSRLDLPADAAQTRLALARAHAAGNHELAIAEARGALLALDELGGHRARRRRGGAPARTRRARRAAARARAALTRREQEVLAPDHAGLSNPEIARRLSSAARPPPTTSAACWPSSASATAPRPSPAPTRRPAEPLASATSGRPRCRVAPGCSCSSSPSHADSTCRSTSRNPSSSP